MIKIAYRWTTLVGFGKVEKMIKEVELLFYKEMEAKGRIQIVEVG